MKHAEAIDWVQETARSLAAEFTSDAGMSAFEVELAEVVEALTRKDRTMQELFGVLAEVATERVRQDEKWGGYEFDDEHPLDYWGDILGHRAGQVAIMHYTTDGDRLEARRLLLEIAAIAVAAVETIDRQAPHELPAEAV